MTWLSAGLVLCAFSLGLGIHESFRAAQEAREAVARAERGAVRAVERAQRPRRTRTFRDGVLVGEEVRPPLINPRQEN